jgi:hypothetical protein
VPHSVPAKAPPRIGQWKVLSSVATFSDRGEMALTTFVYIARKTENAGVLSTSEHLFVPSDSSFETMPAIEICPDF